MHTCIQRDWKAHKQTEKQLAKLPKLECTVCTADIDPFYELSSEAVRLNKELLKQAAWLPAGGKLLCPGRVVIVRDGVCLSSDSVHIAIFAV